MNHCPLLPMQPSSSPAPTWTVGKDSPGQICQLLRQLAEDGVKFFCFDYFDTLAVREIEPEFTKQLAARLHSLLLGGVLPPEQLYVLRQQLERELCAASAAAGGELEFYMEPFARAYRLRLQEMLGDHLAQLRDADKFTAIMLAIETTVEKAVQRPCAEVVQALAWLKQQGLRTVLVSDFYLPGHCFTEMLRNLGLDGQFDHIYVSADHGLAKSSGRMYERICADLRCQPNELLMIGDNPHSDVMRAQEKGLRCLHLLNPGQKEFYSQWRPERLDTPAAVRRRFNEAAAQDGLFKETGTSLWLFTWNLLQSLLRRQARDVFFFSKEGEFLKKLFDQMQSDLFGVAAVRSHYILVSRKATFLASLKPIDEEDFSRLFYFYRNISPRDFLLSLNIEEPLAAAICQQAGVDFQTRLPDLCNQPAFRQLLAFEPFRQLYETRRSSQKRNFFAYLNSFGVDYEKDGLCSVDVGWKGSIQDNLWHILGGRVEMQGYYAGFLDAAVKQLRNDKEGLLFDNTKPLPYFNVYNNNRSLFEMMLGASHGSADGYFMADALTAFRPDDHRREIRQRIATADGELLICALDMPEERALFKAKIKPLQEQMLAEAKRLNAAFLRSGCALPDLEWFARRHARMVFTPTRQEVEFFESLYHLENFGVFEYTDFRTAANLSLKERWRNLVTMRKNPAILEVGTWPPIILRRLGLDFYRHINGRRRLKREFGTYFPPQS
uniref:HAD-IA family hydrolase n=1 Tax=Candidatus Electronema sp. TaxID=2698783 RepID=UPI004055DCFE